MIKAFCQWRAKRYAISAVRAMHRWDYESAKEWMRLAKKWEIRASSLTARKGT